MGPLVFAERYRCSDCESRFDVATPFGTGLLVVLGLVVLVLTWTYDRLAYGDGPWIAAIATLGSLACVGLGLHGITMRRRHPPA